MKKIIIIGVIVVLLIIAIAIKIDNDNFVKGCVEAGYSETYCKAHR